MVNGILKVAVERGGRHGNETDGGHSQRCGVPTLEVGPSAWGNDRTGHAATQVLLPEGATGAARMKRSPEGLGALATV